MAADWFQTTVGNYCPFLYGKGLPREKRIHGNIPVVSSAGISGLHDQALVQSKGVVIGRKGTVGSITYCDKPFWPIDTTFYIPDEPEKRNVRFTYYLLKTIGLETMNSDSAVPGLNRDNAHAVEIKIPALAEQKRIASILGALDDKIELNRRMNAKLEDMARTLFKSWFVDFDPVRAKLDGRPPAGMDAATAELFPDAFEESALGLIPKGWQVCSLDKIAAYLNGLALQKYPTGAGPTLPVIKIAQLRKGDTAGADRCNTELPPIYIVQDGDVLFSWSGSLEVELWCGGPGALNQHLFKVTSIEYPKWFYYLWTLDHLDEFRFIAAGKATTMGHIQRGHLTAAKVLIPPGNLLDAMSRILSPLIEQPIANRIQSRDLAAQREMLLQRLLVRNLSLTSSNFYERKNTQ